MKKKVNQRVRLSARVDGKKDRNANEMRIQNVAIIMRSWRDLLKRRWITIILLSSITMTKACDRATQRCCLSTLYPHMARGNISCRQHRACCVALCGVVWCGVVWCGVVWCGVVWCGVVWCGVVWCGVVWCGVVWCGVVWCGVVWCGVVWCGVPKALLPNGNGRDALHTGNAKREGCVSERMLCVCVCVLSTCDGSRVAPPCTAALVQGCPWDSLLLRLLVQLKFVQSSCHSAPWP